MTRCYARPSFQVKLINTLGENVQTLHQEHQNKKPTVLISWDCELIRDNPKVL